MPPQVAVGDGEVAQAGRGAGVARAEGGLGDRQRPLLQRERVGVPPQGAVGDGEIRSIWPGTRVGSFSAHPQGTHGVFRHARVVLLGEWL